MRKSILWIILGVVVVGIISFVIYFNYFADDEDGFKINNFVMKRVLKTGGVLEEEIEVTNKNNIQMDFNLRIENLGGLVLLDETEFNLAPDEKRKVGIVFNAGDEEEGVYVGRLVIGSTSAEKQIPVILEIQSQEIVFAASLDVSPDYKDVSRGDLISVGVKVVNLNDSATHSIDVSYEINNLQGGTVFSEAEQKGLTSEVSFTKTVVIQEDLEYGDYVFSVVVKEGESVSTASYLFSVSEESQEFNLSNNFLVILIFVFLFAILILVIYLFYERDKFFEELRRQHTNELRYYSGGVDRRRNVALARAKPKERGKVAKKFARIRKSVLKIVKQKHKSQRREFSVLRRSKKKNKKDVMKQKLGQWKKEGFSIGGLIKKAGVKKDIGGQVGDWKKKGFDTSVLKK